MWSRRHTLAALATIALANAVIVEWDGTDLVNAPQLPVPVTFYRSLEYVGTMLSERGEEIVVTFRNVDKSWSKLKKLCGSPSLEGQRRVANCKPVLEHLRDPRKLRYAFLCPGRNLKLSTKVVKLYHGESMHGFADRFERQCNGTHSRGSNKEPPLNLVNDVALPWLPSDTPTEGVRLAVELKIFLGEVKRADNFMLFPLVIRHGADPRAEITGMLRFLFGPWGDIWNPLTVASIASRVPLLMDTHLPPRFSALVGRSVGMFETELKHPLRLLVVREMEDVSTAVNRFFKAETKTKEVEKEDIESLTFWTNEQMSKRTSHPAPYSFTKRFPDGKDMALQLNVLSFPPRWEPLVDTFLIRESYNVTAEAVETRYEGLVYKFTPAEKESHYPTLLRTHSGALYLYYSMYRNPVHSYGKSFTARREELKMKDAITRVAVSHDGGKTFSRPLVRDNGGTESGADTANNIVLSAEEHHTGANSNFSPFRDDNPECPPQHQYKALGGYFHLNMHNTTWGKGTYAFSSPDGFSWSLMHPDPVLTPFHTEVRELAAFRFDSGFSVFWDAAGQVYRTFVRYNYGIMHRHFQMFESKDFIHWSLAVIPEIELYGGNMGYNEGIYTSNIVAMPGAPHLLFGNLMYYTESNSVGSKGIGLATSRDRGRTFARVTPKGARMPGGRYDPWIGPHQTQLIERVKKGDVLELGKHVLPVQGGLIAGGGRWSLFVQISLNNPRAGIERYSVPEGRIGALCARGNRGEFRTFRMQVRWGKLNLNFDTGPDFDDDEGKDPARGMHKSGSVRVEVRKSLGTTDEPVPGMTLEHAIAMRGSSTSHTVGWTSQRELSSLAGQTVTLRVVLEDACVYAIDFSS